MFSRQIAVESVVDFDFALTFDSRNNATLNRVLCIA